MEMMQVVYCPHPLRPAADREVLPVVLQEGDTLATVLQRLGLGGTPLVVDLNGTAVPREALASVAVRASDVLVLQQDVAGAEVGAWVAAGVSSKTGITLATAVTIAAVVAFAVNMIISFALSALASSLMRKRQRSATDDSPTAYSIQGGANAARQYEPLPVVLGEHRLFPDYASMPFSEFVPDATTTTEVYNRTPAFETMLHVPFAFIADSEVPIAPWTLVHTGTDVTYYGDHQERTLKSNLNEYTQPHTFIVRATAGVPKLLQVSSYEEYVAEVTPPPETGGE